MNLESVWTLIKVLVLLYIIYIIVNSVYGITSTERTSSDAGHSENQISDSQSLVSESKSSIIDSDSTVAETLLAPQGENPISDTQSVVSESHSENPTSDSENMDSESQTENTIIHPGSNVAGTLPELQGENAISDAQTIVSETQNEQPIADSEYMDSESQSDPPIIDPNSNVTGTLPELQDETPISDTQSVVSESQTEKPTSHLEIMDPELQSYQPISDSQILVIDLIFYHKIEIHLTLFQFGESQNVVGNAPQLLNANQRTISMDSSFDLVYLSVEELTDFVKDVVNHVNEIVGSEERRTKTKVVVTDNEITKRLWTILQKELEANQYQWNVDSSIVPIDPDFGEAYYDSLAITFLELPDHPQIVQQLVLYYFNVKRFGYITSNTNAAEVFQYDKAPRSVPQSSITGNGFSVLQDQIIVASINEHQQSPCEVPNVERLRYSNGQKDFLRIKGVPVPEDQPQVINVTECSVHVRGIVESLPVTIPSSKDQIIYVLIGHYIIYFMNTAGGTSKLRIKQITETVVAKCSDVQLRHSCLDLLIIRSFLVDAYKLNDNTEVHLRATYRDEIELMILGVALTRLNN